MPAVAADPTDEMLGLLSGYWYSQVLYVMAELGIADCLAAGPKTAETLAQETACHAETLYRFLRALASTGILREVDPHTFGPTPLSETLRSERLHSLRPVARLGGHPLHWQAWGNLLHSVRTGETAFDAVHGKGFFAALVEDPVLSSALHADLGRLHEVDRDVVEISDLGRSERIVDVGGGTGQLSRRIASAHPRASVILFDQPHVLAMAPAAAGVERVSGNFLESVPRGGDAYFLKFVLHDWDDERAGRILRNCREAMQRDGRVFVIEMVVPDDASSSISKTHDINMLVLTGGRERTVNEYRSLFSTAGLELVRVSRTRQGVGVLEAQCA
jgi:hypothetical protein